jgi:hypothetical protein
MGKEENPLDVLVLIPILLAAAGLMLLLGSPSKAEPPEPAPMPDDAVSPVPETRETPVAAPVHAVPALIEARTGE